MDRAEVAEQLRVSPGPRDAGKTHFRQQKGGGQWCETHEGGRLGEAQGSPASQPFGKFSAPKGLLLVLALCRCAQGRSG